VHCTPAQSFLHFVLKGASAFSILLQRTYDDPGCRSFSGSFFMRSAGHIPFKWDKKRPRFMPKLTRFAYFQADLALVGG